MIRSPAQAPARATEWARYVVPRAAPGIELLHAHYVGHAYERHSHDCYAIGVTEAGVQAFHYRGGQHASAAGQVMVLNPGEPHDGHAGVPEGFTYKMLYIPPEAVRRVLEDARDGGPAPLPFGQAPVLDDPALAQLLATLHDALAGDGSRLAGDWLFDHAVRLFAARHAGPAGVLPRGGVRPGDAALRRVRDFLHEAAPAEEISGDDLARIAGTSRFHLWRSFRRTYGLPPHAYRLQLRLAAAKQLLGLGEPPAAVAAALGFADQSHLTKRFKGAFGVTPGQFAAAARRAA